MKTNNKFSLSWKSMAMTAFMVLLVSIVMSCNNKPPEHSKAAQAMRGKEIFKEQCAVCHGGAGVEANKALVDSLVHKPLDLTTINMRRGLTEFPVMEIARIVDGRNIVKAHGPREMPVWGEVYEQQGMTKQEIKGRKGELIAYLMSIQKIH